MIKQIRLPNPRISEIETGLLDQVRDAIHFDGRILWTHDRHMLKLMDLRVTWAGKDLVLCAPQLDVDVWPLKTGVVRGPAILTWMVAAGPSVKEMTFNVSDGHQPSGANASFSAFDPSVHLVPDFRFFRDRGYKEAREFAAKNALAWNERSDDITWRGRLNGVGVFTTLWEHRYNPAVMQRVRMALLSGQAGVDFKLMRARNRIERTYLEKVDGFGDPIDSNSWVTRKFAIDIDGYTNAWDNFLTRLIQGCCVIKVGSQMGYRQWYYDRLEPWVHYVPVAADMSDLTEIVAWCRDNDERCCEIAQQGQKIAEALTFERVLEETGESLRGYYANKSNA